MTSVLQGKSTLLLLSTGSGKSLCYQMPAYLLREEGLTLVVSPLVSLMADQLMRLPSCLRGAVVSGQQSREQTRTVMRAVRGRLVDDATNNKQNPRRGSPLQPRTQGRA